MSNQRNLTAIAGRTPNNHKETNDAWRGWDDVGNGRGFPPEYDTWTEYTQKNYEIGRGRAAAVKAVLGFVPRWRRNWKMTTALDRSPPAAVEAVISEHAYRLRGEPNLPVGA